MAIYPELIETSTEKLDTIEYAGGQIIHVVSGDKEGYVYYDSIVRGQRILENTSGKTDIEAEKCNWKEPATITLGGINAGDLIVDKTPGEVLYDIYHPYIAPTLNMKANVLFGLIKQGETISLTDLYLTSSGGSIKPFTEDSEIKIYINDTLLDEIYTISINEDTNESCSIHFDTDKSITENTTIKVTSKTNGRLVSVSDKFTFVNPVLYGTSDTNVLDDCISNASEFITTKKKLQFTFNTDFGYSFIMYDATWGNLSSIIDPNGFNITSSYNKSEITIDEVNYYMYISIDPSGISNFKITFNF